MVIESCILFWGIVSCFAACSTLLCCLFAVLFMSMFVCLLCCLFAVCFLVVVGVSLLSMFVCLLWLSFCCLFIVLLVVLLSMSTYLLNDYLFVCLL